MSWLLVSILVLYCHILVQGSKSGPYKVNVIRVGDCKNPTLPVDQDPPCKFYAELYNTSTDTNILRGKTIIFRDFKNKQMRAKKYLWENNKWKVNYVINNNACNRVFFPAIASVLRIKYDLQMCMFYKGEYDFDNYSIDRLVHVWMPTQDYGHVKWKVEFFTENGTWTCYDYELNMDPLHKEKATTRK